MKLLPAWHSEEWQPESSGTLTDVTGHDVILVTSPTSTTRQVAHDVSGVTADTYGDADHVPQIDVSDLGHVTNATPVAIRKSLTLGLFQFTTVGSQGWIGGDPSFLAAANADQWTDNFQGYTLRSFGVAGTKVAIDIFLADSALVGGSAAAEFEIYINGVATGVKKAIADLTVLGQYSLIDTNLAVADFKVIGLRASMTGTAISGSLRADYTVSVGL